MDSGALGNNVDPAIHPGAHSIRSVSTVLW